MNSDVWRFDFERCRLRYDEWFVLRDSQWTVLSNMHLGIGNTYFDLRGRVTPKEGDAQGGEKYCCSKARGANSNGDGALQ